jgi:hypothetical protein
MRAFRQGDREAGAALAEVFYPELHTAELRRNKGAFES